MKSTSYGSGQVFWKDTGVPFLAERSQAFDVQHDGEVHDYAIEFQSLASVHGVRTDPSRGRGKIEISAMRMTGSNGETACQWNL